MLLQNALSIVIATKNRAELLEKTLTSIQQNATKLKIDCHIVIQGKDDASEKVVQKFPQFHYSFILSKANYGDPRNQGIANTKNPWILFLDDDAFLSENYFQTLEKLLTDYPTAAVFGGPNLTPQKTSYFAQISGLCFSSFWGSGPSYSRYISSGPTRKTTEHELILCNLIVKRDIFDDLQFAKVQGGEENLLLYEILQKKKDLIYSPDLFVFHERRKTLLSLIQQVLRYGEGRGLNLKKGNFSLLHITPLFALILFVSSWVISPAIGLSLFAFYLSLNLFFSLKLGIQTKSLQNFSFSFLIFPHIQLFYCLGIIKGFALKRS